MESGLPRFVGFRFSHNSVQRFMQLHPSDESLKFNTAEIVNKTAPTITKFELVAPTTTTIGHGQFRHIRSCYNNKYLRSSPNFWMSVTASADQPEEDRSKMSCTLFEFLGSPTATVQLRHVATGSLACIAVIDTGSFLGLEMYTHNQFGIVNWAAIVIFPEYVTIKNDVRYLRAIPGTTQSLLFILEEDVEDNLSIMYQSQYERDGRVRFLSVSNGQLLRRMPQQVAYYNPIWASPPQVHNRDEDTMFETTIVQDPDKVILRNVGSGMFCYISNARRFNANTNNSTFPSVTQQITEAVFVRSIYNIKYRLNDARIYNEQPLLITHSANNGSSSNMIREMRFQRTLEESTCWERSSSFKSETEATFKTGVPFIFEGKVTLSVAGGFGRTWGETKTTTKELDINHEVIVPPFSTVRVTLMVIKGNCDVPFSYHRRDILADGRLVISAHDDGLFTGVSHYSFKYETTRQDLPTA